MSYTLRTKIGKTLHLQLYHTHYPSLIEPPELSNQIIYCCAICIQGMATHTKLDILHLLQIHLGHNLGTGLGLQG